MKTIACIFREHLLNKWLISEPNISGIYHIIYLTEIFSENVAYSFEKKPRSVYRFYGFHTVLEKGKNFNLTYIKLSAEDFNMWKFYSHYKDKHRIDKMRIKLAKAMLSIKEAPKTFETNLPGMNKEKNE